MKLLRIVFSFLLFFAVNQIYAQGITVDDTRTKNNLVDLLIGQSCASVTNINISSNKSVAYFNKNGSRFPISEGVLIRSGIAKHTEGRYTGTNLDSEVNTNSDIDLQKLSDDSGQLEKVTDAAFLEFDFVPPSKNFNFNFLFSSNEYGEWQCGFSDVFAFVLTDLVTGEKINLAVVPSTGKPISVKEIRDNQYNATCNSVNPELFGAYNVIKPNLSNINMRGRTVVMNASATIKPNNPYNIKLVVGDYNDSRYDSAVFIEAGSFGNFLDLGEDLSICNGETVTLNSGFNDTTNFTYQWRKNNVLIVNANKPTLDITLPANYEVSVINKNTNCIIKDDINVRLSVLRNPPDLIECDNGNLTEFNLTKNGHAALNIDPKRYNIEYFASLNDIANNNPIDSNKLTNYRSIGGVTIYSKVKTITSSEVCTRTINFKLLTNSLSATKPLDFSTCEDTNIDLSLKVESQILNGLDPLKHSISYFTSLSDAQNNSNAIANPNQYNFTSGLNSFSIWARLSQNDGTECIDITDFNITVNPTPQVDQIEDVISCTSYTLEPLTNGKYFTETNGNGTQLNAGDKITESTTLFIYNEENGCSNQESFNITIVNDFKIETEYCGEFIVPNPKIGDFFTAPDGLNGTGRLINPGTVITSSGPIYYYSNIDGTVCANKKFDIVINPIPLVDKLEDVTTCTTYKLPALTNGKYFTESGGLGTQLNAGDDITISTTLFIYDKNASSCSNEISFKINIVDLTSFNDVEICREYIIPETPFGNYFTEPNGNGTLLNANDRLFDSRKIYFYVETDNGCADNIPINITINKLPKVDNFPTAITCTTPYTLPPLTNGNYFTGSGGTGTRLNAGEIITKLNSGKIYVYNSNGNIITELNISRVYIYNTNGTCENESILNISIRPLPPLDSFSDVFSCTPYTLPILSGGAKYFTETNAQGTELFAGDIIDNTKIIYVFNQYEDLQSCTNEAFFTVHITGVEVDKPTDVNVCDSYILPQLTNGEYFTEANAQGTKLNAGDEITTTQTIYIFKDNGSRFYCKDQHQFTVTVTPTPQLPVYNDVESCDSYTLPNLTLAGSVVNYYRQPNKVDLIDPSEYTITDIGTQTIYVHASAIANETCTDEKQFDLTVYPLLDLNIEGGTICVDSKTKKVLDAIELKSGLDPNLFTVNWFLDNQLMGTGPNYTATKAGTYIVKTIKLTPDVGADCNYNPTEVIVRESIPEAKVTFLTNSFTAPANIKVEFIEEGFGRYLYRLNDGHYQTSNLFHNLEFGEHKVYIKDTSGICSNPLIIDFKVINHPSFFTPNNDGENETWNIYDLRNHPEAVISIFDRYGKLITQIKPTEQGWDGTYRNGKKAPSTDYWFTVTFLFQGKPASYSSNFSLIRKD